MPEQQLMEYFKFDADDLYANQNRRFTEKQRSRLISLDEHGAARPGLAIGIVLAADRRHRSDHRHRRGHRQSGSGVHHRLRLRLRPHLARRSGAASASVLIRGAMGKTVFKLASVQGRANIVARESAQHR